MTLPDWQWTLNGLTMGDGTDFGLVSVTGLGGQPPVTHDLPLLTAGALPARDSRGPMILTFAWEISGTPDDTGTLWSNVADFATAWQDLDVDVVLAWHVPSLALDRHANGRSRGYSFTIDDPSSRGLVLAKSQFWAGDGLIFDSSNAIVAF